MKFANWPLSSFLFAIVIKPLLFSDSLYHTTLGIQSEEAKEET